MKRLNTDSGFILPTIIIVSLFLTTLAIIVAELAVNNFAIAVDDRNILNSQLAADAGLDRGIVELNIDNDYTGTTGEVQLMDDGDTRVTYEITVIDVDSDTKFLESTGRSYRPTTATDPRATRTFSLELTGIGPLDLGDFSIITGAGGLFLENSAKIVAGDVYVNGEIVMSNTAQIGTTLNPVNVRAAHSNCPVPADATYPTVCAMGENGEPITLTNSAHIYGDVQGTNQTDGTSMTNPGLVAGSPPVEPLPDHDRDAQKAAVTNTMSAAAASCNSNSGTRVIPANTHITGGDVEWKKKCVITILGDVWIDGSVEMTNTASVAVADSLGTTLPTIMIDGDDGISFRNSTKITANSQDTGARVITYYSTAGCSPDCADVTGTDLFNSREYTTIYMDQSFSAPESLLYARWSQLLIDNSGDIGALLGQTVKLRNSTTVTFGTSVIGGGGPVTTKTWIADGYRRVIN